MSWSIILGRKETGFSIFRPTDGLDEGPVILSRSVPIELEDTLGSLYFGKIFPMGVAGLIEAAEMVAAGKGPAIAQYEPAAGYEGIIRDAESAIRWASHIDQIFNLIRGCNPAPVAWTTHEGKKLFMFDSTKRVARTFNISLFIHAHTRVNGKPPAGHAMMRFFQVTPPTVHRMVVTLEQAGLIARQPGTPRSVVVLVREDDLPRLKPRFGQTVKTSVTGC